MKRFVLIGAAGYIAPRHFKAIKETGNDLVAVFDPHDSVGILDSYFPNAAYFSEFERFDRHIQKICFHGEKIDYVVVCSPNYLHDAHVRWGLRIGADVICEKPIVINPKNCKELSEMEEVSGREVMCILQLRLHPAIELLHEKMEGGIHHEVDLKYITRRGRWYAHSWKGDVTKSGGLVTNIGIHFFDSLIWIFGEPKGPSEIISATDQTVIGKTELERASVSWELSIDEAMLPDAANGSAFRSFTIDGEEVDFSDGFTDLHTKSYQEILSNNWFTIEDALPSIELTNEIRNQIYGK